MGKEKVHYQAPNSVLLESEMQQFMDWFNSEMSLDPMSAQIKLERKRYYEMLEKTQSGTLDITTWLSWFLNCLSSAIDATAVTLNSVMLKSKILGKVAAESLNERQKLMLGKFLDGFDGKLTSSKWAKIAKCSQDTAARDIQDLINKGILTKDLAGGRSTNYLLVK